MNENIIMKFNKTIFDSEICSLIENKLKDINIKYYYENEYKLILNLNCKQLEDFSWQDFDFSYKRIWHSNFNFLEKLELTLRIIISKIKEDLEENLIFIKTIEVNSDFQKSNTELQLLRIGLKDFDNKKKETGKIHFNIHLLNGQNLLKISDLIEYMEYSFYIDERNNNKNFYNSLLLKKANGKTLDINKLSEQDWKKLVLKEKVIKRDIANLFGTTEKEVDKIRRKFISSIKQYDDEYVFYFVMYYSMTMENYYSNFCIPLLEQMKSKNVKAIYEYLNLDYHELFKVEEELKRQKEIEKNNLAGGKYVMPLSGVLLKKFYWAIKNNQLDRKILKSNWFNIYYGKMFFKNIKESIEESHILDLYETGKIYEHPSFLPYEELYKKLNLKESIDVSLDVSSNLIKVDDMETKRYEKKKVKRKIVPRNYINLAMIKTKIGKFGEELVYNYEYESLKNYPELQEKIEKTYLIDDGAGYDIISYDYEGKKIFIEVKTNKTSSNKRIKFYISKHEDEFISSHKNAYIYYIYDLNQPKLRVISQKTYLSYYKNIVNYEINQEISEV